MSAAPVPPALTAMMVDCEIGDACNGAGRFPARRWIETRCVYCGTGVKGFTCGSHWLRILAGLVGCPAEGCGAPLVKTAVI